MPFVAAWIDLEITGLSELIQTQKDKYHDISHVGNLKKNDTKELFYKTGTEKKFMVIKGGRGAKLGVWV